PEAHHAARALALRHLAVGDDELALQVVADRKHAFPRRLEPLRLAAEVALLRDNEAEALLAVRAGLSLRPQQRSFRQLEGVLVSGERELARRYGVDARSLPRHLPTGATEVGAHVVSHTVALRVLPSGLGQVMIDRVIDVHDPRKVPDLHAIHLDFAGGRESVEVEVAERITHSGHRRGASAIDERGPDGKQDGMYSDVRQQVVRFDELEPGDRLHVRMTRSLHSAQNLLGDFFGHIEPIEQALPVMAWRLVIEAPRSRPIFHGGRRAPSPRIEEPRDRPDVRVYEFSRSDVPRIVIEPDMPPYLEVAAYLSVSTYSSWADLAQWYRELVKDRLQLDSELRTLAHHLVAGAADERERVQRIFDHVVEHTRYVGLELGLQGYQPFPVTEVYRRRYGDCKDTASLLVALFDEVGIPAQLALLRTADRGQLAEHPATMWAFNHAVAYVPSQKLMLDGTAERSHFLELPPQDQGALYLLIPREEATADQTLALSPLFGADENLNSSHYEIEVTAEGELYLEGRERFRGVLGAEQRRSLYEEKSRTTKIESSLALALPGAELSSVAPTSLTLAEEEVGYDLTARVPHRAILVDEATLLLPLSLYPQQLATNYARQSSRQHDVWAAYPWRTRNVMRYRLPPGYVLAELPPSGRVNSEHLSFEQRISLDRGAIVVEEDTRLLSRRIPKEDYPRFRAAALAADQLMQRRMRLVREAR
ncbi:MAG: DUF3857 domain-containing protein, partial [Myxococcota bacterium]